MSDTILAAVTRGTVAGVIGTVALTMSERLEMAVSGREASNVPGQVGANLVPGRSPRSPSDVQRLDNATHWIHGISMGALRGVLDVAGVRGAKASAAHFALVWAGDAALYRVLGIADVPWRWDVDELASDVLHKGVYALVTGAVYDAMA